MCTCILPILYYTYVYRATGHFGKMKPIYWFLYLTIAIIYLSKVPLAFSFESLYNPYAFDNLANLADTK